MLKQKKAQFAGEVFKYALVAVFSIFILFAGYKFINGVKDRACSTQITKFEIDMRNIDKSLRAGEKELQSHDVPCNIDKIYFFDTSKKVKSDDFEGIPLLKESLESGGNSNVFLVQKNKVVRSFYAGNIEMIYPNYICFVPKFDKISFFAEGTGKTAAIRGACNQPECTMIPENISEEQSRQILQEAVQFGCRNCPNNLETEAANIKLTRQNVDVFRRFLFCDGVTEVQIIIKPKTGADVKDFRFYEFIPKACVDDLNKYLDENIEGEHYVKGDPMIVWHFTDLGEETKISYKINKSFDEECKKAIKGLGVAQSAKQNYNVNPNVQQKTGNIESPPEKTQNTQSLPKQSKSAKQKENEQNSQSSSELPQNDSATVQVGQKAQGAQTTEQTESEKQSGNADAGQGKILNFKSSYEQFRSDTKKIEKNLRDLTIYDGEKNNLVYSISKQSTDSAKCEIKGYNLDCEQIGDGIGPSEVFIEVTDGNLLSAGKITILPSPQSQTGIQQQPSNSAECEKGSDCGFFETCKSGKCCILGPINPFCPW